MVKPYNNHNMSIGTVLMIPVNNQIGTKYKTKYNGTKPNKTKH